MKGIRVLTAVVALLVLPLVAVHAQGRGKRVRANEDLCASEAGQSGKVPPGQAKKCPAPDPDPGPVPPPSGVNYAGGTVYADLDADGTYSPFAGDTVLVGWTVQLLWNGAVVQTSSTDVNGAYRFDGLGNTGSSSWELCVVMQSGFSQGPAQGGGYSGCAGTGYASPFNSAFATMFQGNFSMLPL
jgi:hypothetical protein